MLPHKLLNTILAGVPKYQEGTKIEFGVNEHLLDVRDEFKIQSFGTILMAIERDITHCGVAARLGNWVGYTANVAERRRHVRRLLHIGGVLELTHSQIAAIAADFLWGKI